jgi:alkanesulfonate monooxygenase SsuD/methylene tetrahydromethanopterin reductase-like flavin-dependent oxidoreductase (luciferase family)
VAVEVGIHVEPEGAGYEDLLKLALTAESAGFAIFGRSDHYLPHERPGAPLGPTDAWATLAGLARETSRIRLSAMMNNPSFRHPAVLAVMLAQVDAMAGGGRVEMGMGAGWFELENEQFGFMMPATAEERCDRRAEQIAVLRGIWSATAATPFSFDGNYYTLTRNPGLGAAAPGKLPSLTLATAGTQRSIEDAARYADECNVPLLSADATAAALARLDATCDQLGRARGTVRRSATILACCGSTDAEIDRRAAIIGLSGSHDSVHQIIGPPGAVRESLAPYLELNLDRIYFQIRDAADASLVRLLADEVVRPLLMNEDTT